MLIEDCTELHLYVGKAINSAYQNPGLPFDLGIRQNLVGAVKDCGGRDGKTGNRNLLLGFQYKYKENRRVGAGRMVLRTRRLEMRGGKLW